MQFNVILEGTTLPGYDLANVKTQLAALIKRDNDFAGRLLNGRPMRLKSGVDAATGQRYVDALRLAGATASLQPEALELDANLDAVVSSHPVRGPTKASTAMRNQIAEAPAASKDSAIQLAKPSPRGGISNVGMILAITTVIVLLIGILVALVVPRIIEKPDQERVTLIVPRNIEPTDQARVIAAKNDIAAISQALKLYRMDNGRYPTGDQGLAALVRRPTQPPAPPNWEPNGYLQQLPKDPWGNDYQYINPGLRCEIDVFSMGADRQPGGTGYDADIGTWDLSCGVQ